MELGYGIFSVIFGLTGLALNLVVAIAIAKDKKMANPTYRLMTQLALSDAETIIGVLVGPGLHILVNKGEQLNPVWVKILAYVNACGFRLSAFLMVFLALSRYAHFYNNQMLNKMFTKRNHVILCLVLWGSIHLIYSPFLFYEGSFAPLGEDGGLYAYTNATLSQVLSYFDAISCQVAVALQIIFNVLSVAWVLHQRKMITTPSLRSVTIQEIKLLIQCGIDSLVFCSLDLLYYTYYYTGSSQQWVAFLIEILALVNHIDCAVLYLCFNKQLRSLLIQFCKIIIKFGKGKNLAAVAPLQGGHEPSVVRPHAAL